MRISDWSSDVCSSGLALPVGEVGEIICGHPTASDFTYQGDDGKRLSIDRAGLIATGDMGYLDEAGYLFICDRATDMIISGGVNIYPAASEAALERVPAMRACAVFGIPADPLREAREAGV